MRKLMCILMSVILIGMIGCGHQTEDVLEPSNAQESMTIEPSVSAIETTPIEEKEVVLSNLSGDTISLQEYESFSITADAKDAEGYKEGFEKDDTMNVMSVTKSVTSLLIGIAMDQGLIKSVDDFVMDYYKEIYTPKRGEQTIYEVTIKHLLIMTAPYKGKSEPWTKVCTSEDWTLTTLDILGGRKGITNEFRYHTLGVQILLGIIRITSGRNVLDFANEYLFKPLGITPRSDAGCESKEDKFEYLMNKNDHGKVWFLDPTGMPTAGWGLSLSAYEMAQIGLMVLNNGVYNNTRIVSENWIERMTKSYISTDEKFGNQDYGFLWWLPHRTREVIAAIGDGGNIIYIDKKNQIVVAITAHFKPMVFDRVEYIEKNIVEALTKR